MGVRATSWIRKRLTRSRWLHCVFCLLTALYFFTQTLLLQHRHSRDENNLQQRRWQQNYSIESSLPQSSPSTISRITKTGTKKNDAGSKSVTTAPNPGYNIKNTIESHTIDGRNDGPRGKMQKPRNEKLRPISASIQGPLKDARKAESSSSPPPRFAYAFVLGGIHENRPAYKGFLYNILIAARLLRRWGSTADFWIWTQLSPDSNQTTEQGTILPKEDLRLLQSLNFTIQQLPKPEHESFAQVVYSKFRVLQMTQYERVMFLDGDILPMVNLDYLFHLSVGFNETKTSSPNNASSILLDTKKIRPNLILATRKEPCNTGVFMVQPQIGDWERFQQVVQTQHEKGQKLPYPHFDWSEGWGYNFVQNNDQWEAINTNGTKWRFHAGHSDQGLMYYWAKFVKQDVSIVIKDRLQHWVPGENNKPRLEREETNLFESLPQSPPLLKQFFCGNGNDGVITRSRLFAREDFLCYAPYKHFRHFAGPAKPWQQSMHQMERHESFKTWFQELEKLNSNLNMRLDLKHWNTVLLPTMKASPLGKMAMWSDQANIINKN